MRCGHCRRPFIRRSAAVRARRRRRSCAVRSCAHHPRPQRFRRPTWRWFYISRIVAWLRVESRRSRVLFRGRRASRRVRRAQILADNVFYPLTYSDSLNLDDMTDQTQARFRTAEALGDRRPAGTERHADFRLGALFGLGSPLPHLRRDWARRSPHLHSGGSRGHRAWRMALGTVSVVCCILHYSARPRKSRSTSSAKFRRSSSMHRNPKP
jgi:hypothetical protein